MSIVGENFVEEVKQYEEQVVNDLDSKYKSLYEAQERLVLRLEAENDRLLEQLSELKNASIKPVEQNFNSFNSSTLPQGIQLPSAFRASVEERLRQQAFGKRQVVEETINKESNEV